jgi:hypothetical protein
MTSPCEKVEGFAAEFLDGAKLVNQLLTRLDRTKVDLFARADLRLERLMLLLADYYRQDVRFPMLRNDGDQMAFLRSYYADLATYTHRPLNPAQPDPGNFGSADFRWVTPETVELDLISRKSFRAAGVYALPGETFPSPDSMRARSPPRSSSTPSAPTRAGSGQTGATGARTTCAASPSRSPPARR